MAHRGQVALTQMRAGQSGVVAHVMGGRGAASRLAALGVRPGKRIRKVSAMAMRGPVTIEVDRTQVAIGYGMAAKIAVQPIEP
ncbi:MAG: FeoA family protein [Chloroflexota bacterium]